MIEETLRTHAHFSTALSTSLMDIPPRQMESSNWTTAPRHLCGSRCAIQVAVTELT